MKKEERTNVMRVLDSVGAKYEAYSYPTDKALSGLEIAERLSADPECVFKTLVTVAASKKNYVFVIPAGYELDLKRAAASVGEKSVSMLKQAELLPLTGYVHGGCSPIGMKKLFKTVVHITAQDKSEIIFSAGKIGRQVKLSLAELSKVIEFSLADIAVNRG
ncbi:MAG: aminoacyl-tRNA deacylase [Clostridia bacterium]|nr:aminoacyl-tRNA deacylase [Clostridia bacterium]